jgi:hypothetical protein
MSGNEDLELGFEDEEVPGELDPDFLAVRQELERRAASASMSVNVIANPDLPVALQLNLKCGPRERPMFLGNADSIRDVLAIPFESYTFLCGFEAMASYTAGTIEAALRPVGVGFIPGSVVYHRVFGKGGSRRDFDVNTVCLEISSPATGLPSVEISPASTDFTVLTRTRTINGQLTLKLAGCNIKNHDGAVELLRKTADALFFQIDLLKGVPVYLERERQRRPRRLAGRDSTELASILQYPRNEYDKTPMSLYWYARSATAMPLLQFLAFYQVVEFYFPVYAEAEAQRKLKGLLKDPTFRADREADVGRLLTAIKIGRSGSFGSEKQQLKATIDECVDPDELRQFLTGDEDRNFFYTGKQKSGSKKRIQLGNPEADPRSDVATRLYDIRCAIVHTKNDSTDEVALLLPFSAEADQLVHDIELMEYVARSVLVACSSPFQASG